jgi:DNA-binding GntR family transcriptional regulator
MLYMSFLPPLPPPLQRKSLGDQIYESIRESIVSLRLKPGSMIYENELAETLGVSRTPIREAIRLLVSEELLDVLPQRGTRIARISERKVNEARFIREHLELGAFRLAAKRWNERDRTAETEAVKVLIERQQAASREGDPARFLQLDEAFHQAVLEVTGNETLLQVIFHMRAHVNRVRCLALTQFHHMDRVIEEHEAIFQAIRSGDEEQTADRLQRHIGKLDQELPELRVLHPDFFED